MLIAKNDDIIRDKFSPVLAQRDQKDAWAHITHHENEAHGNERTLEGVEKGW